MPKKGNFKIKEVLSEIKARLRRPSFSSGRNPERDWRIVIFVFSIVLAVAAAGSFYLYQKVKKGDIFSPPASEENAAPAETISRELMDEIIFSFEKKALNLKSIKASPKKISDPSK